MRRLQLPGALIAVAALVGCAQPAAAPSTSPTASVEATPSSSASPTSTQSPTPTPSPTPTDALADWQEVATPNGTATFRIPPGWTAEVGGEQIEYDGETHWVNQIAVRSDTGAVSMSYSDGPYDDVGPAADFGVVRSAPVASLDEAELAAAPVEGYNRIFLDHRAAAWWVSSDGGSFRAHAGLSIPPGESQPLPRVSDGHRSVAFGTSAEFSSEADAVAWLESDEVTSVLEIVATLDLTAIPAPALP